MSDGLQFARRIRTSPYFERVRQHGVTGYSVYNHMILPNPSGSVSRSLTGTSTTMCDLGCLAQRQVEITGLDAARLVQWLTLRDLRKAEIGRCYYIPVVDRDGGMLNDPVLLKLAEDRLVSVADSDLLPYVRAGYCWWTDVSEEPDVNLLAIQGSKASVMAALFGDTVASLKRYFTHFDLFGTRQIVSRGLGICCRL